MPEPNPFGTSILKVESYDVAVLGLGVLGSATLRALADRGARVLGIDRFSPPHRLGSSHGGSRITREAIGEGTHLTPIVRRSHDLWREMEQESGATLFKVTGLLVVSSRERTGFTHVEDFFAMTLAAARAHGIAHETLGTAEIRRRFPQFRVGDGEQGYYEPGAGFLEPEACVTAQIELARRRGAHIRCNEAVQTFRASNREVVIEAPSGSVCAKTLVIAAGAWLPEFLPPPLACRFRIFRQVQFWYEPRSDMFRPDRFPVFIWELRGREQSIYGFPQAGVEGVKIATEQYATSTTAAAVVREIGAKESRAMYDDYVAPHFAEVSPVCTRASICLYTVTPDFGFVIDRHPDNERVVLASCCSGHGFKHAPALGEAIADLALDGRSRIDISPFALARFEER